MPKKTINVLHAGSFSAAVHGSLAVLLMPILAFVLLVFGAAPPQFVETMTAEKGMLCAVAAPLCYAVFGFLAGALAAFMYNQFIKAVAEPELVQVEEVETLRASSASALDAA